MRNDMEHHQHDSGDAGTSSDRETTRSLSRVLQNMKRQKDGDDFVQEHGVRLQEFHEYLHCIMEEAGLDRQTVIDRSGISKNYIYNIMSGIKKNPGRDKVLALCVASEMDYAQTQRALELTGHAPLYPRSERDVRIAIAINEGVHRVIMVNLMLDEYGLAPLDI